LQQIVSSFENIGEVFNDFAFTTVATSDISIVSDMHDIGMEFTILLAAPVALRTSKIV